MYITVVGGGNSTPIFATQAKLAGHTVAILTRKPEKWNADKKIGFKNEDKSYLGGQEELSCTVDLITSDAAQCIPKSDMIFIAGVPIHFNEEILRKLKPFIDEALKKDAKKKIYLGTICAYGGFNWIAHKALGDEITKSDRVKLFGTQQIPWTCGTLKYGEQGVVFGQKASLRVVTETGKDEDGLKKVLEKILVMKGLKDSDFLVSALYPNNPSVHPPILYGLFKDWDMKRTYELGTPEAPVLIYAELNQTSADYVDKLNKEQCAIVKKLSEKYPKNELLKDPNFDYMKSLLFAYGDKGVLDKRDIYHAIRSTPAYAKHKIAYVVVDDQSKKQKTDGGETKKVYVQPDVTHKFFTTDLPYGLCTYKDIANMLGVKTPVIDEIIYWNQKLINKEYMVKGQFTGKDADECVLPSKLGLTAETLQG